MPGYARDEVKSRIMLRLRKGTPMSTQQLAVNMRVAYSSVREALVELKKSKEVCVVSWTKTVAHPIRYWGVGSSDAPRPPPITKEERLQKRRDARKRASEQETESRTVVPRRDPAAAWF